MARDVFLVHGLWMPGMLMSPLAARIARAGFRSHVFDYAGRDRTLEVHAERLLRFIDERAHIGPVHLVAHSMGGRVVLEALRRAPELPVASVLLLGTPVNGCFAGRRLARHGWGRWMLGASEQVWREHSAPTWNRAAPLGVIAGSRPVGLARALGRLTGTNDGVAMLEETALQGMSARLVMPVGHSEMLISARVARQVVAFLTDGKFHADVS
ncbi:MAG: alpha/beta fold hydrolase [Betaproteobacteria bacterium]|nr:alpha/beta fold hydrolase [Betaproteobacteria bacterium]